MKTFIRQVTLAWGDLPRCDSLRVLGGTARPDPNHRQTDAAEHFSTNMTNRGISKHALARELSPGHIDGNDALYH